jgi:hypothetical protein
MKYWKKWLRTFVGIFGICVLFCVIATVALWLIYEKHMFVSGLGLVCLFLSAALTTAIINGR